MPKETRIHHQTNQAGDTLGMRLWLHSSASMLFYNVSWWKITSCPSACKNKLQLGEQVYEDSDVARQEQQRIEELAVQSEFDKRYAVSLIPRGRRPAENTTDIASLLGLSVDACIQNRVNVSEALRTGRSHSSTETVMEILIP